MQNSIFTLVPFQTRKKCITKKTLELVSIIPSILNFFANIPPVHFSSSQPLKIPHQFKLKEKVSTIHFKLDQALPFGLVKNS